MDHVDRTEESLVAVEAEISMLMPDSAMMTSMQDARMSLIHHRGSTTNNIKTYIRNQKELLIEI